MKVPKRFLCGLIIAALAGTPACKKNNHPSDTSDKSAQGADVTPETVDETVLGYTFTKKIEVIPLELARESSRVLDMGIYYDSTDDTYTIAGFRGHVTEYLKGGFASIQKGLDDYTQWDQCRDFPATLILHTSENSPLDHEEELGVLKYFDVDNVAFVNAP